METSTKLLHDYFGQIWKYLVGFAAFPIFSRVLPGVLESARKRWDSATTARRIIATQLDPLLKAADELQGKIRSLAEEDFREFRFLPAGSVEGADLVNLCSTLYLFAQFWVRFEILRRESFHAELTRNSQGDMLMSFLRCLESRNLLKNTAFSAT
jgi:hypothetical protein